MRMIKESLIFTVSVLALFVLGSLSISVGSLLFYGEIPPQLISPLLPPSISAHHPLSLFHLWRTVLLCGWEDLVFVLPVLLLFRAGHRKTASILLVISTGIFMTGHFYLGLLSGMAKFVYPAFASYYAHKYGISRVIIGHTLLDIGVISIVLLSLPTGTQIPW